MTSAKIIAFSLVAGVAGIILAGFSSPDHTINGSEMTIEGYVDGVSDDQSSFTIRVTATDPLDESLLDKTARISVSPNTVMYWSGDDSIRRGSYVRAHVKPTTSRVYEATEIDLDNVETRPFFQRK